jgi:cupin 2 domain-containing protein
MIPVAGNIYRGVDEKRRDEAFEALLSAPNVRIERIVSTGHASPPDFWYDQDWAEWVIVIEGSAGLRFEGEDKPRMLARGDYIHLPAHTRHRVEWTNPDEPTVWLAVHYR